MSTHEKDHSNNRTDTGALDESEIVGLYRGFSRKKPKEARILLTQTTLSVWAAALILCSVLVFGLDQVSGRLQGMQEALEQTRQDNKLLLEGLDALLVKTERPSLDAKAQTPPAKPSKEPRPVAADESGSNNLAKKYKIYYRSKAGEDLAQISKKFGVSEEKIRRWNALEPSNSLMSGQVLVINKSTQAEKPIKVAHASPEKASSVRPPPQIETNPDDTTTGETGRDAAGSGEEPGKAPTAGETGTTRETAARTVARHGDNTVHIVQPGESLSSIGRRYGVSWLALAAQNAVEPPGAIYVGQRLKVPEIPETAGIFPPQRELTYKVQEGDNLYRIGRLYDMRWEQIARANGINQPTQIYVGQVLKIPAAGGPPEP